MRSIDPQAARVVWTVFLIGLLVFLLYSIRRTLFIFIVALFFAYMLSPVVDLVNRFTPPRFSRTLSLAIVYLLLVAVLVGAGAAIGSRIVQEASSLAQTLPQLVKGEKLPADWKVPAWVEMLRLRVIDSIREQLQTGVEQAMPFVREVGQRLLDVLGNIGFAVLVPILGFFFLKDGRNVKQAIVMQVPRADHRELLEGIFADMHDLLAQYIRALVILSLATFTVYSLFFQITGVPYALLLGGLAALLEFIPVLGPLVAAVIVILVCLLSGFAKLAAWLVLFIVLYRLFQDYVLSPYLMSAGVELHPLLVIFGALAGEQVAGVAGMFLSIPVMATLRVIYVRMQRARVT